MNIYTLSEARQKLPTVLDEVQTEDAVLGKCRDGSELEISLVRRKNSPLDVQGIDLSLSAEEIVSMLRESRKRDRP